MSLNESIVEDASLGCFGDLGYAIGHRPHLAPGEPAAERDGFGDVVLVGRLREAIARLNPAVPADAREEALRKVLRVGTPSLTQTNRAFHRMLRDGVPVEYPRPGGSIAGDHVRLVDFSDPQKNDWLAVNQFTVIEAQHNRRPDIVVFVNGLPLGLIELKNASDEDATIWSAYAQFQTYKAEIAFYDALANNQSAKEVMGDDKLRVIATALVTQVRKSVSIDWTLRESAQAKIRVLVKRILNKFGYPPDLQDAAVQTVLAQARLLCAEWA